MKASDCIFIMLTLCLSSTNLHAQTIQDEVYFSPQRKVEVETGRFLNLYCSGQGAPVVVLEAGLGASSAWWGFVQPELSKTTTTCSYDRAGIGFSDSSPHPSSVLFLAKDLNNLLKKSKIPEPYILVGHSYGGMITRYYADEFPAKVAGMVLVDSSHEDQATSLYAVSPNKRKYQHRYIEELRICAEKVSQDDGYRENTEIYKSCVYGPFEYYSEELNKNMQLWLNSPAYKNALLSENENVFFSSADQLFSSRSLHKKLPLIVLSKDASPKAQWETVEEREQINSIWNKLQKDHASISTLGEMRVIKGSGHLIPMENPQAIIKAVNEIIDRLSNSIEK